MEHVKTHKIQPVHMQPEDTLSLRYVYEEDGQEREKILTLEKLEESMIVDTVIVYKTENEYGLKAGRAIIIGEDDGTHKDVPLSESKFIDCGVDRAIKEFYAS